MSDPNHWPAIAPLWHRVGPPLKPAPEDVALFQAGVDAAARQAGTLRALILGVTVELARLRWPEGTELDAVDRSASMIANVWPGAPERAHQASWTDLPFAAGSRDLVLCDGGLAMIDPPGLLGDLAVELARVMAPGARFVTRLYTPGRREDTVEDVLTSMDRGEVPSLNALKLQLWAAMQRDAATGVRPRDVRQILLDHAGSWSAMAKATGWPLDHVAALDAHRDSTAVYHLVDADEVAAVFEGTGAFTRVSVEEPAYALGDCCPVVTFVRG